jgi:hypothetical protein
MINGTSSSSSTLCYSVLESSEKDFELLATAVRLKNEWNLRQTARVEGFVFNNIHLDDYFNIPQSAFSPQSEVTMKMGTIIVGSEIKGLLIQVGKYLIKK